MKIKIIFAAVAILFSINASMANQYGSTLTFWSAKGEKLVQPVMIEEPTETLPIELRCEFKQIRSSYIFRVFDLGEITKPEKEEELPYYIPDYRSSICQQVYIPEYDVFVKIKE